MSHSVCWTRRQDSSVFNFERPFVDRTLIWLAPDQRYCRKEHAVLWQAFSSDLAACWDLLGSTGSSSGGGQVTMI